MKFSLVNIDKKKQLHLQVKSAEWYFKRITADTKTALIGNLRRHIEALGDNGSYENRVPVPRVFPLVELSKSANDNLDVTAYNGLVPLHVADLLRDDDLEAVKEAAKMMPMTYAAFVGADGRSLEILVAVAPKEGQLPQREADIDRFCKMAYDVAFGAYGGVLPKPIERQSVAARFNFRLTLDAEPYVNPAAVALKVDVSNMMLTDANFADTMVDEQREMDMKLYADYELMYKQAAEEAYEETADVIESQRLEAYITELARRMCLKGVPEEETFLHLRNHYVFNNMYEELEFRAIVEAVYSENKPERSAEGTATSLEMRWLIKFLTTRYVFRYNTVLGYTEYRPNNTWIQDWAACDENVINGMSIEARLANLDIRDKDVRRYVRSNIIRRCDPLQDYFWKIRDAWDGKTDHIAQLARTIPCKLPQWEQWFRKWFLSMVAQWLGRMRDYGNALVPLLISPQGDGKSFFCRNLLPRELQWGFLENLVVEEKKQTLQAMHNFLIISLDEFNQISQKTQEGFLKNVIQLPRVKIKRPYGKHVEDFPRMASFIATCNEASVLSDPTGNRRFIGVQLTAPIDTNYKPNYAALYNQAYTIVTEEREQYWMTPEEVKELIAHNRQFEVLPPAVQYFNEYYTAVSDESEGQWLSPTAIYTRLRQIAGSGLKANGVASFGRYLKNIEGLQSRRIGNNRQYLVREKE
jgi:hypothetical protein